jgi:hypothetical protein
MTRVLTSEIKTTRVMTRVAAVLKSDPRFDPRKRTLFVVTQVTPFTRVNACFFRVTACFFAHSLRWGQVSTSKMIFACNGIDERDLS